MDYRSIKTEDEYKTALKRVEKLMDIDSPSDNDLEKMNILSLLIEQYEKVHYPLDTVDPIEYIKFKMDQDGLSNKDMAKYIGSLSKVSEVLSYKVKLNLNMIHNLNEGLGIPLDILSRSYGEKTFKGKYPPNYYNCFNELVKRSFFPLFSGTLSDAKKQADKLISSLIQGYDIGEQCYCRKTEYSEMDSFALFAWQCRIKQLLKKEKIPDFSLDKLPESFLHDVARLSYYMDGCKLVKEHLNKFGIHFITLRHLPKTNLDGAAFLCESHPVVALTLRCDRVDNFWFTLMHELAHVYLHLRNERCSFFDDTISESEHAEDTTSNIEAAANRMAEESLVPQKTWMTLKTQKYTLREMSNILQIHPALIARKIQFEEKNDKKFSEFVNPGGLREKMAVY